MSDRGTQLVLAAFVGIFAQSLDTNGLLAFASERQTVVRMEARVGQFVLEDMPLASLRGTPLTDDDGRRVTGLYAVGRQRTAINDTTTAVTCIDHLTAILVRLADCRIESRYRSADGEVRLLTWGPTYAERLASRTTGPSRRHVLVEHASAVAERDQQSVPAARDRQRVDVRSARTIALLRRDATAAPGAAPDPRYSRDA